MFFAFPHIAINSEGEMGALSRPGRPKQSCACGALLAILNAFKTEGVEKSCKVPGVHDPLDPELTILQQRLARRVRYEKLDTSKLDLPALTSVGCIAESSVPRLWADRVLLLCVPKPAGCRQCACNNAGTASPVPARWLAELPCHPVPWTPAKPTAMSALPCPTSSRPVHSLLFHPLAPYTVCLRFSRTPQVAERTITDDLEYLIEKAVDPATADYAVITGVQIHNWGKELSDNGDASIEFVAPAKAYTVVNGLKTYIDLPQVRGLEPSAPLAVVAACKRPLLVFNRPLLVFNRSSVTLLVGFSLRVTPPALSCSSAKRLVLIPSSLPVPSPAGARPVAPPDPRHVHPLLQRR